MASIMNFPVIRYFVEVQGELKKISWPTQSQVILYSVAVIAACVVLAAYFSGIDELLTIGLKALVTATTHSA